ncbi:MAG: type II CRISPR-associated endonuclease Cas1 [Proteobacteria bacterium]|nr:type II CRISPR-associated endonuclease Cas1 [Pseudomonadota bacterium]
MIKKTVEIATAGTRLSISHRQLVIERPDEDKRTLACEDIGVLVVDHPQTSYTQAVFTTLLEEGAAVVLCGPNHLPAGLLLPLDAHTTQTERHRAQAEAGDGVKNRAWQLIVAAKLRQQGAVLSHFMGSDAGLSEIARRVRSGDPDNLEAMAAQRYWPRLFGPDFRRFRDGPPPNNLLNYGYAVVRAAIARAIAAAGLIPTLGVHHRNRGNPFCLADDLMEPYRPYVDWRVKGMLAGAAAPADLDRPTKAALLSLFNETIVVGGRRSPLVLALHASAASLCRMLTEEGKELVLPDGLPVGPDDEEPREADDG